MGKRLTAWLAIAFFVLTLVQFLCAQTPALHPACHPTPLPRQARATNRESQRGEGRLLL